MQKAYLVLENGTVLEGQGFGAIGRTRGELVFHTGAIGPTEALTDPSYYGQIVLFTFPQLGNCGIVPADREHEHCQLSGVVVREFCEQPSNFRSECSVDEFLKQEHVVGIAGIDTRALTQMIRDDGVLKAEITTELPQKQDETLQAYRIAHAVERVSSTYIKTLSPEGTARYSVALLDYGVKKSVCNQLLALGCQLTIFPHNTPAEVVLSAAPNGVILAGGPADPADNPYCISQIQKLFGQVPLFALSLGHQMLALSQGAKVYKMKFGHRGSNQAVRDLTGKSIYVTSQNHGYAVDAESLTETTGVLRYANINDGSCEGIDYPQHRAFSVQFDPKTHGGAAGNDPIWMRFIKMMEEC